jgi:steroid delta-isomerase-like uncharacterized protein
MDSLKIVAEYVAALSASDSARLNSIRASDFKYDFLSGDGFESSSLSLEEMKQFWPSWFAGFQENDYEVIRTVAAEDVVVTQWIFTGTHDNELGLPMFTDPPAPTGITIMIRGVSIYDIGDGLIKRETTYFDLATTLAELGIQL